MAQGDDTHGPEAIFRAALAKGRILLQRNPENGAVVFYPRAVLPGTHGARAGARAEWITASGRGTVHSTTVSHRRPEAGGDRNIALVDLVEGARLMSSVVGIAPEAVRIGMAVRARIDLSGDEPVLLFEPEVESEA
ncbi:MAG: OB-fold domain-containing protein [Pararhodobacter sp.]|nr:OB-fold domain-containing protein [Pararhodobacter sp.]